MQWLIDIIKEVIHGQLGYFDLGDTAAFDFTLVDFTRDNAWHDLQLPGFVPSDARLVRVQVTVRAFQIQKAVQIRTKGNVNNFNTPTVFTQSANIKKSVYMDVAPDSAGMIQYKISIAAWDLISFMIAGWWRR